MADEPQQSQSKNENEEEIIDPIELFTPSVRKIVEGLSFLGRITETVKLAGHTFVLQTLRPEHKYAIATVVQPYRNTLIADKAWRNAHVSVALVSVDGNPHFCDSIGHDFEEFVRGRFNFVSNIETGWYEPTLDYLWNQYQILEWKAAQAVKQLNFLSQTNQKPSLFQDLENILKEQEVLTEETNGDSLPFPFSNEP